jgi:hypothetical protein
VRRSARGAGLALAGLVLLAAAACGSDGSAGSGDDAADGPAVRDANEGIPGVKAIRITSNDHTQGRVDYDRRPPAGGDHNPTPAPCGFYREPIADEFVVHTLEHGAVWLAYSPSLSAEDLQVVEDEVDTNTDVIATPYEQLDPGVAVVATSWGRQLPLDSVQDQRLAAFVDQYQNSDQAPEAGVQCPRLRDGGVG